MNQLFKSLVFFLFYPILLILLSACSENSSNQEAEINSKPKVLATFSILADLAKNVSGDRINVTSITKPGTEIHGYQPTPSDLVQGVGADLIIENGLGLELWAYKYTSSLGNIPTLVLSEGIQPILIEGDKYAGKPNPHLWMSPKRTMIYIDRIKNAFIKLDPQGKDLFEKNSNKYKEKLRKLDQELLKTINLIPRSKRVLVSCEGAFSYLANDYGLEEAYLWPVNAESQVTPRRMLNLINFIKKREVPTVFCESTVSSKAQKEVARASGAKFGGIFYVDSLSEADGPAPTLLDLQRHNIGLILKGLNQNKI